MKKILYMLLILGSSCMLRADGGEAPKKDLGGTISCLMTQNDIEGTILWRSDSFSEQPETGWSEHKCYIGYPREGDKDGKRIRKIEPILILPAIENDSYEISVESGVLKVTTTKSKRIVVTLNLANIAPTVLTGIEEVEQGGTGQPATRPESESEGSDKPQPEAEGRSR